MKIIVDTNIAFSAVLNSNSRIGNFLLDTRGYFEFYSCKYLQKELYRHLQKIQTHSHLNNDSLFELLNLIESRIFFIDEELLPAETIANAMELVSDIDFNDFAFVALTNHLNGLLWTGDKKLIAGLQEKGYKSAVTTSELSMLLHSFQNKFFS